jgi:hypothetical protein
MNEREQEGRVVELGVAPGAEEPLPYVIVLWDLTRQAPERVLGRAVSALLANAVFGAAQAEYVGRKIQLKRGDKVLSEST